METFVKILGGIVAIFLMAFFHAWALSVSWNIVMPPVFNLPTITMVQAYVGALAVATLTHQPMKKDFSIPMHIGIGIARGFMVMLCAWIVVKFFI